MAGSKRPVGRHVVPALQVRNHHLVEPEPPLTAVQLEDANELIECRILHGNLVLCLRRTWIQRRWQTKRSSVAYPYALFGEFAAIPIRRPETTRPTASSGESPFVIASNPEEVVDDELPPATPPWTPPPLASTDEEWEEIALDTDGTSGQRPVPSASGTAAHLDIGASHHVDLMSEPMDLDAFVRDLHTVESTANAQPMIPVVDLSHVSDPDGITERSDAIAIDALLPEPVVVTEEEIRQEARATLEAEIAAAFATEGELNSALGSHSEPSARSRHPAHRPGWM